MSKRTNLAARTRGRRRACRLGLGVSIFAAAWLVSAPAFAQQWNLVGPRAQGMGGAGMAVVDDSTAFYWNPAIFGFKKKGEWDVNLPITVNLSVENELLEQASDLAIRSDDLATIIDDLENGDASNFLDPASLGPAVDWLADFNALGSTPQSVHTEIAIGLLGHAGNFGFGGLSNTTAYVFPDVDLSTIGLDQGDVNDYLQNVAPVLPGETDLKSRVANIGGYWGGSTTNGPNADRFVDTFTDAGIDTSDPAVQEIIVLLAQGIEDGESFAANDSGIVTAGLSIQEIGLSYGFALPSPWLKRWLHKKISVGATAKYMMGIAFVRTARYDDISSGGLGNIDSFSDNRISHRFGLDLGIDYRPFEFARIGLVARNVNVPKFDGGEFGDIKVRPQVRLGMAAEPIERWIVALDVDLTENRNPELENSPTVDPFRSRLVSLGTEYTIPIGKPSAIALRFGTYKNTVDEISEGWALTGGLGLKLWSFWLDLSAGGGLERERIRTDTNEYVNIPDRLNVGLGLKWEKSL
jgi:hypothetical protein